MAERTIHELLKIVRENVDEREHGICMNITRLYERCSVSVKEALLVESYVTRNMPKIDDCAYGWPVGEWPPRIKFLDEHIEKTAPVIEDDIISK